MGGYLVRRVPGHPVSLKTGYVRVHRLVMEQHLRENDPSSELLENVNGALFLRRDVSVHHINESKIDNGIENLSAIKGNGNHIKIHSEKRWSDGSQRRSVARLTEGDVEIIRKLYASGSFSQISIAERFSVHQTTIHCIVRGKSWKTNGR